MQFKAICVVDRNINSINQQIIEQYGAQLIWIESPDINQSLQEKRIETVKEYVAANKHVYWTNQYNNQLMQQSYSSLAEEIAIQCPSVKYIYVPVSTCGTVAGISSWMRNNMTQVRIIAVDVAGSKIFGQNIGVCHFPGMGSKIIPGNLKNAFIDDIIIVSDYECVAKCHDLVQRGVFVGASSGGVVAAIEKSTINSSLSGDTVVGIFPDRGDRYLNSIFNKTWCEDNMPQLIQDNERLLSAR